MNARREWVVRSEGPLATQDVYAFGVIAGVLAGIAMSGLLFLARLGGTAVQLEQVLGAPFARPGVAAFSVGFVLHLLFAGAMGALYTRILWRYARTADPFLGMGLGLVHGVLVALFLALASPHDPIPWDWSLGPISFREGFGAIGFFWTVLAHVVFGGLVGLQMERPLARAVS